MPDSNSGEFQLALVSAVILVSGFREAHDHILMSHDSQSRATTLDLLAVYNLKIQSVPHRKHTSSP
jgi:hypothetical protein